MTLTEASKLTHQLMEENGLYIKGWTFYFDNAKVRFGSCHHGLKRITLSRVLVELNEEQHVRMTILHEIAHALVGADNGHNNIWKKQARALGHDGSRTYSDDVITPPRDNKKWKGACPNCKRSVFRYSRRNIACGSCCRKFNGNQFSDKYKFVWTSL